jgi:hypothetical protein
VILRGMEAIAADEIESRPRQPFFLLEPLLWDAVWGTFPTESVFRRATYLNFRFTRKKIRFTAPKYQRRNKIAEMSNRHREEDLRRRGALGNIDAAREEAQARARPPASDISLRGNSGAGDRD